MVKFSPENSKNQGNKKDVDLSLLLENQQVQMWNRHNVKKLMRRINLLSVSTLKIKTNSISN